MKESVKKMMNDLLSTSKKAVDGDLTCFINNDGTAMAFYREDDGESILVNFTSEDPDSPDVGDNLYFVIDGEGIFHYDTRQEISLKELQDKMFDFKNDNF